MIRGYTNIEQSRKLAEILPLESADMYYWCADHYPKEDWIIEVGTPDDNYECICAWSLAALLDVIKEQGLVDLRFLQSTYDNRGNHLTNVWCCTFENLGTISLDLYADNSVDACVNMIIKLNELKML